MKSSCICLVLLLTLCVYQSSANYYGKRGEKLDGFREYLTQKLEADQNNQEMEAREVLKTISTLIQRAKHVK